LEPVFWHTTVHVFHQVYGGDHGFSEKNKVYFVE
jgi:hypothetical protein